MNEAMPRWRTFSSEKAPAPDSDAPPAEVQAGGWPRWLLPLGLVLGGSAAAVAVVGILLLIVTLPAATDGEALFGEPLDVAGLPAAAVTVTPGAGQILVDVAGAVVRPGLHRLSAGDRVGDAIEAAGGFAPRADLSASSQSLNLAQPLEDGAKVLVPELGIDRAVVAAAADDGLVDINHATQPELEELPGIGPVTARKIIAARDEGRFGNVRDLRSRGLVGASVFDGLKDLVRAG